MKKAMIVDIISSLFIILFLYTGISKLLDFRIFNIALHKSPLLKGFAPLLAAVIPPLEIIIALLLLIPFFSNKLQLKKWGLYGSAILMTIFAIYIGYMVEFRTDRPCTCGGVIQLMNWHQHMYFNIIFSLLAYLSIWLNNKASYQDPKLGTFA